MLPLPILGAALFFVASCRGGEAQGRIELTIGTQTVQVEVADEPDERSLGLMYRTSLAADAGMLFVYPDEALRSFWMKNTKIPLSIAFISADGHIVSLADMRPGSLASVPSEKPAGYALEMNQGWFAAHGVHAGDAVGGLPAPSASK
jgi:uncharacterized protein